MKKDKLRAFREKLAGAKYTPGERPESARVATMSADERAAGRAKSEGRDGYLDAAHAALDATYKADGSGKPEDHRAAAALHRDAITAGQREGRTISQPQHEMAAAHHEKQAAAGGSGTGGDKASKLRAFATALENAPRSKPKYSAEPPAIARFGQPPTAREQEHAEDDAANRAARAGKSDDWKRADEEAGTSKPGPAHTHGADIREHMAAAEKHQKDAADHLAAGRHEEARVSLGQASDHVAAAHDSFKKLQAAGGLAGKEAAGKIIGEKLSGLKDKIDATRRAPGGAAANAADLRSGAAQVRGPMQAGKRGGKYVLTKGGHKLYIKD